jgi:hypothetical protein
VPQTMGRSDIDVAGVMNPKCLGTKGGIDHTGHQYHYNDGSDSGSEDYVYEDLDFLDAIYGNECENSDNDDVTIGSKTDPETRKEIENSQRKSLSRSLNHSKLVNVATTASRMNQFCSSEVSNSECGKPIRRVSGHSTCSSSRLDSASRRYSSRRKSFSSATHDYSDIQVKCKRLERGGSVETTGGSSIPKDLNRLNGYDEKSDEVGQEDENEKTDSSSFEPTNDGPESKPVTRRSIRPNRRRASVNKAISDRVVKNTIQTSECNVARRPSFLNNTVRRNSCMSLSSSAHSAHSGRLSRNAASAAVKPENEASDHDSVSSAESK